MASFANTPSSSKRELSSSSTPSPSTTSQPTKKKKPESKGKQVADTSSPVSPDTQLIIDKVMFAMNEQMNEQISIIKNTITEQVINSVAEMGKSLSDVIQTSINDRMTSLEQENKLLHNQVLELKTELDNMKMSSGKSLDTMEQYSRRNCLRIAGVPESPEENTDDIILDIAKSANVALSLHDIDRSHRLQPRKPLNTDQSSRPRDIIIKCVSYRSRDAFFRAKYHLKNSQCYSNVYINEDLTRNRAALLKSARNLVKIKNSSVISAWSRDGRIYVKYADESRRVIETINDLI